MALRPLLRWSRRLVRWSRRLVRWSLRFAVVGVIIASFALNAAMATLAPVASAASGLAGRLLGVSAVETVVDRRTSRLQKRAATLQAEKADLAARNADLANRAETLEGRAGALRSKNADLATENGRLSRKVSSLEDGAKRMKSAIDAPSQRIAGRVFRSTARDLGSSGVEWVPIVGALAGTALLALELRDSCAIMEDMNELRVAAGAAPLKKNWFADTCRKLPGGGAEGMADMTVPECRAHAEKVEDEMLGRGETLLPRDVPDTLRDEAGRMRAEIKNFCDCMMLNPGRSERCATQLVDVD